MIKRVIVTVSAVLVIAVLVFGSYKVSEKFFNSYFDKWGEKLVALDKKNLLSDNYGAAWKYVLDGTKLNDLKKNITSKSNVDGRKTKIVDGVRLKDYPSLKIVKELNSVSKYSNSIRIEDRNGDGIAIIQTDHTRAKVSEFPKTLINSLVAAEDKNFYKNKMGFQYSSFVRAVGRAIVTSLKKFHLSSPKGTSTITQQVAKLFVSHVNAEGQRVVGHTLERKIRELKIASALRKIYTPNEILEVYLNHCIAGDYGLIGVRDISKGILGKDLNELNDGESVYLSRMVKWGRNLPVKIRRQCQIDMPRIAKYNKWDEQKVNSVLKQINSIKFVKPKKIETDYPCLTDLAAYSWIKYLKKIDGYSDEMNFLNPNSLIRKRGNLVVKMTIDLPLQNLLMELVNKRGYGSDTVIYTDVRVGSRGETVKRFKYPKDSLRIISVLKESRSFYDYDTTLSTKLDAGDTLITNIRYKKIKKGVWRRSQYFYTRSKIKVRGQYFAYSIMDSKTGELLAYYSRDGLGSNAISLFSNKTPNGSSVAKPILNALNFDIGIFKPYEKWSDSVEIPDTLPWGRKIIRKNGKPYDVEFYRSAVKNRGYRLHNHGHSFEGEHYIFDLLSSSNNILGAETIYRLNSKVFNKDGTVLPDAYNKAQFFYRMNIFDRMQLNYRDKSITGVRYYKELARVVGTSVDTMNYHGRRLPISDSAYSISLGTLELSLFQQMHLFNVLYNNTLIENPVDKLSLLLKSVEVDNQKTDFSTLDTIRKYHPFADINNIRPTLLGLHKRLVSNRWDGLNAYDIAWVGNIETSSEFSPTAYYISAPLANIAKSGTTDDIITPYNSDAASGLKTNYGLWNAVVRVDFSKIDKRYSGMKDLTIASIGECNKKTTGPRDGKTLHKFLTKGLLKKAGIKVDNGFFKNYNHYLVGIKDELSGYDTVSETTQAIIDTTGL